VPFVTIEDMTAASKYLSQTNKTLTKAGLDGSNCWLVPAGAILYSIYATLGISRLLQVPAATNQAILGIIPNDEKADAEFIHYSLCAIEPEIGRFAGHTTQSNLSSEIVRKLPIPDMPKPLQQRVTQVLATVDRALEQTEALLAKQQRIKVGLMHALLTRGLDANGQLRPPFQQAPVLYWKSPIGWIPKDWKADPIEELCDDIVDCPHSTPEYGSGDIPCIRTADMIPGKLLLQEAFRVSLAIYRERILRLEPRKGDIIYSREGERLCIAAPVGDERVCLGQRVMLLRPKPETDSTFMTWAMNSSAFYSRMVLDQIATTSPHVNVRDIKKALIVHPQPIEQRAIGKALAIDDAEIASLLNCVGKLRRLKTGLMQDLLTGRVPVTPLLATKTN
jgi:type I restriction enzyme S subunit